VKRVLAAVLLALAGCFSLDAFMWDFKRRASYELPADDAAGTREIFAVTARDGVRLRGLWLPAALPRACAPAIVYCQGNEGDLQDHYAVLKAVRDLGYDVLTVDYRGNGMSDGKPTEEGTYLDGEAAAAELRRRAPGRRVVYYGESLGAAVCTEVALRARPDALHLDCPFASVDLLVKDNSQLAIPGSFLTGLEYDNLSKIGRVGAPLQIFHGDADEYVRPAHGIALFDAASPPKELWLVPGAGHDTERIQRHPEYAARLTAFVDATCAP
jgi:fermentation-respiration switch protein FrsA (DUF1100 family)